ncbi:hypothetical protein BDW75DRAFT_224886 [Aspergillus navahoensis]
MTETTAVKIPSGAMANMILSRNETDSLRNCLVVCSPNKEIRGARSVARLFVKSSQPSAVTETANVSRTVIKSIMVFRVESAPTSRAKASVLRGKCIEDYRTAEGPGNPRPFIRVSTNDLL